MSSAEEDSGRTPTNSAGAIDSCESVVWQAPIHRIQLLWPSIASAFFGLIGVLFFIGAISSHRSFGGTAILGVGALLFLVTALVVAGIPFLSWQSRKVILTDKRLLVMPGLFEKKPPDIFLYTIESVAVQQGIVGRKLGFGTVLLRDRDGIVHRLENIARPTKVSMEIARTARTGA